MKHLYKIFAITLAVVALWGCSETFSIDEQPGADSGTEQPEPEQPEPEQPEPEQPEHNFVPLSTSDTVILYTSSDWRLVEPSPYHGDFLDDIESNVCDGGRGRIILKEAITELPSGAFFGCENLENISLPPNITKIGSSAFSLCYDLTTITIPPGVVSIGEDAFTYCDKLTQVYCMVQVPPLLDELAFKFIYHQIKVYVPRQSLKAYQNASDWKQYNDIITFIGYDF